MGNNGYPPQADQPELGVDRCTRLGSPFNRGSFTSGGITAGQRSPIQEHHILAYRE